MSLSLDDNQARYQIKAYQPGKIKINQELYTSSLIVTPTQLITPWAPQHIEQLTADDIKVLLELKPALVLLGTGEKLRFPPIASYGELINAGIGIEIMDTSAACRTYAALTAENRNVAAALILK